MPDPIVAPVAPAAPTNGAAPTTAATAAPVAEAEPTFEVTVDGKPQKLTRKQIEKYAGKGAFADKAIRQASEALKTTKAEREAREALKEKLKTDKAARREWLKEHGIETEEFAREVLQEKLSEINKEEMTPEEKRAAKAEAERDEARKEADGFREEKKKAALAEATKRNSAKMEDSLLESCTKIGLKHSPDTLIALEPVVKEFAETGLPFDPDVIAETAKANVDESFARLARDVAAGLKGAALVERLGPEVVKEVLRYRTEVHRNGGPPKPGAPPTPKPAAPDSTITPEEFKRKMMGG